MGEQKYIAFVEPSCIIREGLTKIIKKSNVNLQLVYFDEISQLSDYKNKSFINIIIVNSIVAQNSIKTIQKLKVEYKNAKWVGFVSNFQQREFSSIVNNIIYINDKPKDIFDIINNYLSNDKDSNEVIFENYLSDREIDVLKQLVKGKSNKEIADELFISIHTVVTHRKNITNKLGIKSTAAMAIYAVAYNIIDLNDSLKSVK